jgi:hypothetical protein
MIHFPALVCDTCIFIINGWDWPGPSGLAAPSYISSTSYSVLKVKVKAGLSTGQTHKALQSNNLPTFQLNHSPLWTPLWALGAFLSFSSKPH